MKKILQNILNTIKYPIKAIFMITVGFIFLLLIPIIALVDRKEANAQGLSYSADVKIGTTTLYKIILQEITL